MYSSSPIVINIVRDCRLELGQADEVDRDRAESALARLGG